MMVFRPWVGILPDHIELWAAHLPGRGERAEEPLLRRIGPIVKEIAEAVSLYTEKPFAFFGHSLGAAVAFEVAREMRRKHSVQPAHLLVSGCQSPQCLDVGSSSHKLPDPEFIEKLRALNGTPKALLDNPRMMEIVLPIIRADIEALQTYKYAPGAPLDCPITALGGFLDKLVSLASLVAWRHQTTARSVAYVLPGDHFFINSSQTVLLKVVTDALNSFAIDDIPAVINLSEMQAHV